MPSVDEPKTTPPMPVQNNGYRYIPAEENPWNLSQLRPVRSFSGPSRHDRSRSIVDEPPAGVRCTAPGYRSVLANNGAISGSWYWEVAWTGKHVRLGVALMGAQLDGPLGIDVNGWALCSAGGLFHGGKREMMMDYAGPFDDGCIIGVCLKLKSMESREIVEKLTNPSHRAPVSYYRPYLEEKILVDSSPAINLHEHSKMLSSLEFFKDGISLGIAYTNLPTGRLIYPAFSPYCDTVIQINFGPEFLYPPPSGVLPYCDIAYMSFTASDLIDLKAALFSTVNPLAISTSARKTEKRTERKGEKEGKKKESATRSLASLELKTIFRELTSDLSSFTYPKIHRLSAIASLLADDKLVDWQQIKQDCQVSSIGPVATDWHIFTERLLERGLLKRATTSNGFYFCKPKNVILGKKFSDMNRIAITPNTRIVLEDLDRKFIKIIEDYPNFTNGRIGKLVSLFKSYQKGQVIKWSKIYWNNFRNTITVDMWKKFGADLVKARILQKHDAYNYVLLKNIEYKRINRGNNSGKGEKKKEQKENNVDFSTATINTAKVNDIPMAGYRLK